MSRKKAILLDLDQTLISAEPTEEMDLKGDHRIKLFDFDNMENYYVVFHRPHLQEFLDVIFDKFEVSVWTAATKDYALFIIDKILIGDKAEKRKLNYIFFLYHCNISEKRSKGPKDLNMLSEHFGLEFDPKNTFILDDNPDVYDPQKKTCIYAKPFQYKDDDSHKDDFLKKLIPELIEISKRNDTHGTIVDINERLTGKKID